MEIENKINTSKPFELVQFNLKNYFESELFKGPPVLASSIVRELDPEAFAHFKIKSILINVTVFNIFKKCIYNYNVGLYKNSPWVFLKNTLANAPKSYFNRYIIDIRLDSKKGRQNFNNIEFSYKDFLAFKNYICTAPIADTGYSYTSEQLDNYYM